MLCDPRPGFDFPADQFGPEFLLTSPTTSTRQLSFIFQSRRYEVELTPLSDREFMGAFENYTLFFAKEDEYFVKMNIFITDFNTMESFPVIRLNCYLLDYENSYENFR